MPIVVSPKRKKKRRIQFNQKTYRWLSFLFFALGAMFYGVFFSGFLGVKRIDHQGLSTVSVGEIEKVVNRYLDQEGFFRKRKNIFLVDTLEIENNLKEAIPKINEVAVTKKPLNGLLIDITEKRSQGIYCNNECYYFDNKGLAYEPAPETEGFLILSVQDERKKEIKLGDNVLENNLLNSIFETHRLFKDLTDIEVRRFIIPSTSFDEFWAETEEDWIVYMNSESPKKQIEDLSILINNNFTDNQRLKLDYVDVRIEGRAYYKFKGSE